MAKTRLTPEKEFQALSWAILELKMAYYYPAQLHPSWKATLLQPDAVYDRLEDRYRHLAKQLGQTPSASVMVGFDHSRPSCQLVLSKLTAEKGSNLAMIENLS